MSSEEPGCESERVTTEETSTLSAIIPTLKEERYVGALLSDLAAQTRKPVEVIVVDVGSTDCTAAVVRRFPFADCWKACSPWREENLGGLVRPGRS
jgi:glycosyltransferase involved in cell wall biosynthesis